jgi:hypothetical protein
VLAIKINNRKYRLWNDLYNVNAISFSNEFRHVLMRVTSQIIRVGCAHDASSDNMFGV